jgi:hypothetical protein
MGKFAQKFSKIVLGYRNSRVLIISKKPSSCE